MSKENIKIDEDVKNRLDEIKELPRFKYAEPSYSGCIEYLLDNFEGETDSPSEKGGETSSEQDEEFPEEAASGEHGGIESDRADGKSAKDLVDAVKVDE